MKDFFFKGWVSLLPSKPPMRLSSHVPLRGQAASFNTRCPKKQQPILAIRVPFKRLGFDALGAWDVARLLVND